MTYATKIVHVDRVTGRVLIPVFLRKESDIEAARASRNGYVVPVKLMDVHTQSLFRLLQMKKTYHDIMQLCRESALTPAELGRRGGLKAGRKARKAAAARRWNAENAAAAWWNKN